jgi:hypothetical protein
MHIKTYEVAKGYSNATVRPSVRPSFRNILVNTLESTSFILQTEHATYFYIKCINAYQNLLPANRTNATAI